MTNDSTPGCRIEVAEDGRVLRVTLDNPPENRITPSIVEAVSGALDLLESSKGPALLLLTGKGRTFSKGFDEGVIRATARTKAHRASLVQWNDVFSRLASSSRLTIAAVNGACFGGGLELALACHLRLCSEKARLGLPELGLGLLPGLGGIHRLVGLVGRAKALELLVGGDLVKASEACRIGLVNRVVPHDGLEGTVRAFVQSVLTVDPGLIANAVELTALAVDRGGEECVSATLDAALRTQGMH